MSEVIDRVVALPRDRLAEIDKEQAQLHRTLGNLDGAARITPRKATGSPKRRRSTKRAAKGQCREEVSAILQANPKAKISEIARQIGISPNQVSSLKRQLAKEQPSARGKRAVKKATPKAGRLAKQMSAKRDPKKGTKAKGRVKASKVTASPAG